MQAIKPSELIINPDGSIYHINLKPEHVADTVFFVGDQGRVDKVSQHFDSIEFSTQKREFKTVVGTYRSKRFTVISTGIGPDNIDIVLNELDALVNIDLNTRKIKKEHRAINIVRMGTSGSLQEEIPVDAIVLGRYGIGFDGLLHFYNSEPVRELDMEDAFIKHCNYPADRARPYIVKNSDELESKLISDDIFSGITGTAGGFYGPQGRILRLPIPDEKMNQKIDSFRYKDIWISNLEMETSAIYGLSKLLGHHAVSMNAIIANRANMTFSEDPYAAVEKLIKYTLDKMAS